MLPGTGAETRNTGAFYSTTESKSQSGYFPGAEVASKQISVNQYGAGTKAWAGVGAVSIHGPRPPSLHIRSLSNEAINYIHASSLQRKLSWAIDEHW